MLNPADLARWKSLRGKLFGRINSAYFLRSDFGPNESEFFAAAPEIFDRLLAAYEEGQAREEQSNRLLTAYASSADASDARLDAARRVLGEARERLFRLHHPSRHYKAEIEEKRCEMCRFIAAIDGVLGGGNA